MNSPQLAAKDHLHPPQHLRPPLSHPPPRFQTPSPVHDAAFSSVPHCKKEEKKQGEQDYGGFSSQLARLEERRLELFSTISGADEYARFGQTVGDMVRALPLEMRRNAMCRLYTWLREQKGGFQDFGTL